MYRSTGHSTRVRPRAVGGMKTVVTRRGKKKNDGKIKTCAAAEKSLTDGRTALYVRGKASTDALPAAATVGRSAGRRRRVCF